MRQRRFRSVIYVSWCSASFIGLLISSASPAHAANAISRAIEDQNPCKQIKVKGLGVTVAIDVFQAADIENLSIQVNGNDAKISAMGTIACRTSDNALLKGDASAKIKADAAIDLNSCTVSRNDVHIITTGGKFANAVDLAKGYIEETLSKSMAEQAKKLCK